MKTFIVTSKYGVHTVIVDDKDFKRVMKYKWCVHYCKTKKRFQCLSARVEGVAQRLHYFILELNPPGQKHTIDHINRNIFDNRKENLRLATSQQNSFNRGPSKRNKSGFKGVSLCGKSKKWVAQIRKNKKNYKLGYFDNKEEAALRYDKEAKLVFGGFAYLNFPDKNSG